MHALEVRLGEGPSGSGLAEAESVRLFKDSQKRVAYGPKSLPECRSSLVCLLGLSKDVDLTRVLAGIDAQAGGTTAGTAGEAGEGEAGGGAAGPQTKVMCHALDVSSGLGVAVVEFASQAGADQAYVELVSKGLDSGGFRAPPPAVCAFAFLATATLVLSDGARRVYSPASLTESARPSGLCDLLELPVCPACLERLDPSTSGMLAPSCSHTQVDACACDSRWDAARCKACEYHRTQRQSGSCEVCGETESLWICLLCGHLGCGRYSKAHSVDHFQRTRHSYAMQLGTQRVWDYTGDGYVHRWMQSSGAGGQVVRLPDSHYLHDVYDRATDGSGPVATATAGAGAGAGIAAGGAGAGGGPGSSPASSAWSPAGHNSGASGTGASGASSQRPASSAASVDKVGSIVDEFRHLLSEQLTAQKRYYEEQAALLEVDFEDHARSAHQSLQHIAKATHRKCDRTAARLQEVKKDLRFAEELNKSLLSNAAQWDKQLEQLEGDARRRLEAKDARTRDLEAQLQNLLERYRMPLSSYHFLSVL